MKTTSRAQWHCRELFDGCWR